MSPQLVIFVLHNVRPFVLITIRRDFVERFLLEFIQVVRLPFSRRARTWKVSRMLSRNPKFVPHPLHGRELYEILLVEAYGKLTVRFLPLQLVNLFL